MGSVFSGDLGRAISAAQRNFTSADLAQHRAQIERCRLSGCTPDEHRCLDDSDEWGTFDGPDAA